MPMGWVVDHIVAVALYSPPIASQEVSCWLDCRVVHAPVPIAARSATGRPPTAHSLAMCATGSLKRPKDPCEHDFSILIVMMT